MVKIDVEHQWKRGNPVVIEHYLTEYPQLGTAENVAADLILSEYEVRQRFAEQPDMGSFARRFPRQAGELKRLIEQSSSKRPDMPQASIDTSRAAADESKAEGRGQSVSLPEQFGRYRIVRLLGEGAMGAVYLAHDTQLDREVALKTPTFTGSKAPELIERFYREARSAATLNHPNICQVHDVGEIDGTHFITMAYIEGRTLSDFVSSTKPRPPRHVAVVIRKLALALEHAHRKGVIHRDLKPANIMVHNQREPMIMDFGLARRTDKSAEAHVTKSGVIVGTPAYMSPEQVKGEQETIGPAADVYSLGVIIYELLTGVFTV